MGRDRNPISEIPVSTAFAGIGIHRLDENPLAVGRTAHRIDGRNCNNRASDLKRLPPHDPLSRLAISLAVDDAAAW